MEELLRDAGFQIVEVKGKHISLAHTYGVEVEREGLYKLTHGGSVIAPFDDVQELIEFIRMDMKLNGLS